MFVLAIHIYPRVTSLQLGKMICLRGPPMVRLSEARGHLERSLSGSQWCAPFCLQSSLSASDPAEMPTMGRRGVPSSFSLARISRVVSGPSFTGMNRSIRHRS